MAALGSMSSSVLKVKLNNAMRSCVPYFQIPCHSESHACSRRLRAYTPPTCAFRKHFGMLLLATAPICPVENVARNCLRHSTGITHIGRANPPTQELGHPDCQAPQNRAHTPVHSRTPWRKKRPFSSTVSTIHRKRIARWAGPRPNSNQMYSAASPLQRPSVSRPTTINWHRSLCTPT